jgi:hypothetical protein
LEKIELLEFNPARGQSVRAEFDVGEDNPLEAWWRLIDKERKPVAGGIIGTKILLEKLGYSEGSFEATEESLVEIFAEITQREPEVRIRISFKDGWQNVRVIAATGKERE